MINNVNGAQPGVISKLTRNTQSESTDTHLQQSKHAAKQSTSGQSSELSLTETAAKLRQIEAQIAHQPVVDTQRVESVKKAIASGQFNIDSGRLAEKLLAFESQIAGKAQDK